MPELENKINDNLTLRRISWVILLILYVFLIHYIALGFDLGKVIKVILIGAIFYIIAAFIIPRGMKNINPERYHWYGFRSFIAVSITITFIFVMIFVVMFFAGWL